MDLKPANYMGDAIGAVLLMMIIMSGRRNRRARDFTQKIFFNCVQLTAVECLIDIVIFAMDGAVFPGAKALACLSNTVQAVGLTTLCYLWTIYVRHKTGITEEDHLDRIEKLLMLPVAAVAVIYIINLFVPVAFIITDQNLYQRSGWGFIVAMLVDLFFLLGSAFQGAAAMRCSRNYQFFPALYFEIFAFSGVVMQMIFYGISLIYTCTAVALVGVYFEIQKESSCVDPLSGTYNRQYMNSYLYALCREYQESESKRNSMTLACLLLDADGFKKINDTYGHMEGDQAIRDIGSILMSSAPKNAICARFGGDEFVMILEVEDINELDEVTEGIQNRRRELNATGVNPYKLHFSIGRAEYNPEEDTPEMLLKRLDDTMYIEKRRRHARREASETEQKEINLTESDAGTL